MLFPVLSQSHNFHSVPLYDLPFLTYRAFNISPIGPHVNLFAIGGNGKIRGVLKNVISNILKIQKCYMCVDCHKKHYKKLPMWLGKEFYLWKYCFEAIFSEKWCTK